MSSGHWPVVARGESFPLKMPFQVSVSHKFNTARTVSNVCTSEIVASLPIDLTHFNPKVVTQIPWFLENLLQ